MKIKVDATNISKLKVNDKMPQVSAAHHHDVGDMELVDTVSDLDDKENLVSLKAQEDDSFDILPHLITTTTSTTTTARNNLIISRRENLYCLTEITEKPMDH
ncbi:hypothetical protein GQX74_006459 [Glossina fuscipes]|nr:hypothetical protein GQX74_006459 [Glossina fuscipes]